MTTPTNLTDEAFERDDLVGFTNKITRLALISAFKSELEFLDKLIPKYFNYYYRMKLSNRVFELKSCIERLEKI